MIKTVKIKFKKITKNDLQLLRDWRNSEKIFRFNSQYTLLNMVNPTNYNAHHNLIKKIFLIRAIFNSYSISNFYISIRFFTNYFH